jgi:hypothetical protein
MGRISTCWSRLTPDVAGWRPGVFCCCVPETGYHGDKVKPQGCANFWSWDRRFNWQQPAGMGSKCQFSIMTLYQGFTGWFYVSASSRLGNGSVLHVQSPHPWVLDVLKHPLLTLRLVLVRTCQSVCVRYNSEKKIYGFYESFILFTKSAIFNCDSFRAFSCVLIFWCTIWIFLIILSSLSFVFVSLIPY